VKKNGRDLVLKRGKQVVLYDKDVENPEDVSRLLKDFQDEFIYYRGFCLINFRTISGV
jgi:CRISPR-associated endonuclease Csn1